MAAIRGRFAGLCFIGERVTVGVPVCQAVQDSGIQGQLGYRPVDILVCTRGLMGAIGILRRRHGGTSGGV